MKKLFPLVLMALVCAGTVHACKKKVLPQVADMQSAIIVMDTTQALLAEVEVQIGEEVYRTSWDGRVVLKHGLPADLKSIKLIRKGYQPLTVTMAQLSKQTSPYILFMKEDGSGRITSDGGVYELKGDGRLRGGKALRTEGLAATADEAEVYYTLGSVMPKPVMDAEMREPAPGSHSSNNAKAGSLTAGEVNDFAKWYFWSKIVEDTHKRFLTDWKMTLWHRYTVQVTNANGYPIVSQQVSLIDGQGNTLFQTVTDNTGKAELWANLITNKNKVAHLKIRVDKHVVDAKPWAEGLNTVVLDEECGASDAVDVVFVFDATGSMGDELRYLQAEMRDVISRAKDATGGLAIRTGAVVYRDHGDEYLTRISRLTEDIKTTQDFIDKQRASGGGDFPEAIPEALMAAVNSSGWNQDARARIAFLVLDAPCHKDSATIALLHEQVLNAAAWGVRIVPVVCSGLDESGELLMRSIALATNGTSFFLTDDSGIGHSHLKPTTDTLKVEHLNDMLVRTIVEFSTMPSCDAEQAMDEGIDEHFIPNPFDATDWKNIDVIPHGPTAIYLLDVSGKLIAVLDGDINTIEVSKATLPLSTGIYFLKAFIDGNWYTKKILVH